MNLPQRVPKQQILLKAQQRKRSPNVIDPLEISKGLSYGCRVQSSFVHLGSHLWSNVPNCSPMHPIISPEQRVPNCCTGIVRPCHGLFGSVFSSHNHFACSAQLLNCRLGIPRPPMKIDFVTVSQETRQLPRLASFLLFQNKSPSNFINCLCHPLGSIHCNEKVDRNC
jgi:hypothetical protein